jgi:hypothetical protein
MEKIETSYDKWEGEAPIMTEQDYYICDEGNGPYWEKRE